MPVAWGAVRGPGRLDGAAHHHRRQVKAEVAELAGVLAPSRKRVTRPPPVGFWRLLRGVRLAGITPQVGAGLGQCRHFQRVLLQELQVQT